MMIKNYRMAPEGEGGGGGGGEGAPPPAAPGIDAKQFEAMMQTIQGIAQRQQQHDQIFQRLAEAPEVPPSVKDKKNEDEDPNDPMVALTATVKRLEEAVTSQVGSVADRQDMSEYAQYIAKKRPSEDLLKAADETFKLWRKAGFRRADGKAPTRVDAFRYAKGYLDDVKSDQQREVDQDVADDNEDAELAPSGADSGRRSTNRGPKIPDNLDSLGRREKTSKLAEIADSGGAW